MVRTMIRCVAFVLALLAASAAGATTHFWALQGVTLEDGATVTGSFGYDDASGTVSSWLIRVQGSPSPFPYPWLPFTYLPGDSTTISGTPLVPPFKTQFIFSSDEGGDAAIGPRQLRFTTTVRLDGTTSPAAIDVATPSLSTNFECMGCGFPRKIVAGSLVLIPFPPAVALVDVVEFHHAVFDHYFMSADAGEILALDTGVFTGWARTGYSFKAYVTGSSASGAIHPVCRYYGLPSAGLDSHFYSANTHECFEVQRLFGSAWEVESDNKFQIVLPDTTTGACPMGTVPVYRLFNNRSDSNHRFTTSLAVRATMEALGWIREGYSLEGVVMCAQSP